MKKVMVIVVAALAAAFAPAVSAQEKPKWTQVEIMGILIGHAELCQEFGLRLLGDHRVDALKKRLEFSTAFREQRDRIRREFRGVDTVTNIHEFCPKVDKALDRWAKVYGIPPKGGE